MKSFSLATALLALLAFSPSTLPAQTGAPDQAQMEAQHRQMIGFLPKEEQDRVIAAYNKAMANNSDLKTAQMDLQKGREGMEDASDSDRQTFMAKVKDYQAKLRADMIKEDANLGPVLDKIDAHRAEMMQSRGGPGGAGAGQ